MVLPQKVIITEVAPRDGLQNESVFIPTDIKIQFIELLTKAGFPIIEATAFVNPKKIPALSDCETVMQHFPSNTHTKYTALIPNTQGLQKAIDNNCTDIAVLTAVSETFTQKNTHCSIDDSLQRIKDIIAIAKPNHISVRAYISCTLGCPYEGFIAAENTAIIAKKLLAMGCDEIALADTMGTGTPNRAQALIRAVANDVPLDKIAIHFHDTYGQALANIFACLQLGVFKIDSAASGLGGCPYAKGAAGNVATEKVLFMLDGMDIETGVNLEAVKKASAFIQKYLGTRA